MPRAQAVAQDASGEFTVGHSRQLRPQRQDIQHVDAQALEGPRLLVRLHQPERGLLRAEIDPRMWIEGDHPERRAEVGGGLGGQADDLLVAQVHAVETAHGHCRATITRREVLPAAYDPDALHAPRRGAMISASPSTTALPFTSQTVSRVTWPLAGSSALMVTRAVT